MSREWVISEEDLGCDGAYLSYNEVVRCKDGGGRMSVYRFAFQMVICTKGGEICGKTFLKDEVYPIVGDENGWNMAYEKNGYPTVSLLHSYGDEDIPVMVAYPDYVCLDETSEETPRFRSIDPVVRCKDCKHWDEESTFCLNIEGCYGNETTPNWYCADGERREDGEPLNSQS